MAFTRSGEWPPRSSARALRRALSSSPCRVSCLSRNFHTRAKALASARHDLLPFLISDIALLVARRTQLLASFSSRSTSRLASTQNYHERLEHRELYDSCSALCFIFCQQKFKRLEFQHLGWYFYQGNRNGSRSELGLAGSWAVLCLPYDSYHILKSWSIVR